MNALEKELLQLNRKEQRLLNATGSANGLKQQIYEKVPEKVAMSLHKAFSKAFQLVFEKGSSYIEKTLDTETLKMDFEANNYVVDRNGTRKSVSRMEKRSKKGSLINHTATTTAGFGLGFLGLGIPDIPLFVATMLRSLYETSLTYGYDYNSTEEQIYQLRLIRTALAPFPDRLSYNDQLDERLYAEDSLAEEIEETATVLSDALLVEKFVQGIPIVGIVGGIVNLTVYRKIDSLAQIKYKKRYLEDKMAGRI